MKTESLKKTEPYFDFLCDIVWDSHAEKHPQIILFDQLYNMEYIWLIPNDDNRYEDGIALRDTFIDEGGQAHALPFGPCTVLEMLIGLSYRLVLEIEQSRWEKSTNEWFWVLIDNLGLNFRHDEYGFPPDYVDLIVEKVNNFMHRHYKYNGNGGLFPIKRPKHDQRKIEIWYQMSEYVLENYPF